MRGKHHDFIGEIDNDRSASVGLLSSALSVASFLRMLSQKMHKSLFIYIMTIGDALFLATAASHEIVKTAALPSSGGKKFCTNIDVIVMHLIDYKRVYILLF